MKPPKSPLHNLSGLRVTILGLGLFSGGVATARFFTTRGAQVTVTDMKTADLLQPSLDALAELPINFVLGEHREQDILNADLVVVSPAISDDNPFFRFAVAHGIPVTTEMNLVFERCKAPIIGVTGSNGKTTTTSLIGAICQANDARSLVGGNIGKSLLNEIDAVPADATVVLELSSFQLHRLAPINSSPTIAVVTNLSPNHLDWHGTFEAYTTAKQRIMQFQKTDDVAVLNADDPLLQEWGTVCRGRTLWFSVEKEVKAGAFVRDGSIVYRDTAREQVVCPVETIQLPGRHNLANVLAAVTACLAYGVSSDVLRPVIADFRGVAHRLEWVKELTGVRYYNDSASTTPESTIIALKAFHQPILLIAGGYDKGIPFDDLAAEIARRVKTAVLIGKTAETIEAAVRQVATAPPHLVQVATLTEAVTQCRNLARAGDVVVLSPACASYDQFINFEDRGNQFKGLVQRL